MTSPNAVPGIWWPLRNIRTASILRVVVDFANAHMWSIVQKWIIWGLSPGLGTPALGGETGLNGLSNPIRMSGAPITALPSGEIPGTRVNMERRCLSWSQVCHIVDYIVSQATGHFDAVVAINRGGIVPAGLLSKRLGIRQVFVASVRFFSEDDLTVEWPIYLQFPKDRFIQGKRILLVADKWEQGQAITSVRERIEIVGGEVVTAVLHYCPPSAAASDQSPDILGEQTEETIVYPWQSEHGKLPQPS